jgi:hypothetical protein
MRALRLVAFLGAALSMPVLASAQTSAYICTPDAQVLRYTPGSTGPVTDLWYTGNKKEAFDDCVVGPDGWLYIASGSSILRLDLSTPTATGAAPLLSLVGSAARGLAFNINTLYINTATTGVYTLAGVAGPADPLTFPNAATPLPSVAAADGHGIAFDVLGNLIVSAGAAVLQAPVALAPPLYATPATSLLTRTGTVFGVAVNTCGEVVYADKGTRSLMRRPKGAAASTTLATFASPDYPVAVEIDSNNNLYVVTAQSDTGSAGKLWKFDGSLSNGCAAPAAPAGPIVDLSALLSGSAKLKGLLSARALGLALAPTDASLTRTFTPAQCSNLYNFGYHTVRLTFADCSVPFSVKIDALKSKPTQVNFSAPLDAGLEGLRYSPMGGYIVQYILNDRVATTSTPVPGPPFLFDAQYGFYTQETLGTPGIARAETHGVADPFNESVISDFWDVGVLDAASGERGDDFSKRVLYNSALATLSTDCAISAADWEEPLNTGNPLFKVGQNVKVAFTAKTSTGAACGGGGTMHLSVVRTSPSPLAMQVTQSVGGAQTLNIMSNTGDRYSFNLDTSLFGTGTFQLTVWGDKLPPTNKVFAIGQ